MGLCKNYFRSFLLWLLDHAGVPKPSGLINVREKAIADRVRQVRYSNRLSQTAFSRALGISLDRLASFEYGRTPLTVDVADKISATFDVSLIWLAEGRGRMNPCIGLILLTRPETKPSALLSKTYSPELREGFSQRDAYTTFSMSAILTGDARFRKDVSHLHLMESFHHHFDEVMQTMPHREKEELLVAMIRALAKYSTDWELGVEKKGDWDNVQRGFPVRQGGTSKDTLDTGDGGSIVAGMSSKEVPTWAQLKKTIAGLTAAHGQKAALADELKVSRQVLGNWLSSDNQGAPNAELTLRLFKWSLDPKRKPK